MPTKIASGVTNAVWSIETGSRQLQKDYPYLLELESYGRYTHSMQEEEINCEFEYNIAWDCDCGFAMIGKTEAARSAFEKIKQLMLESVDEEDFEEDLMCQTNPTVLTIYQIPNTEYMVVMAAGYYEETPDLVSNIVYNTPDMYGFECGANYSDDVDPFNYFVELAGVDESFPEELLTLIPYFKKHACRY